MKKILLSLTLIITGLQQAEAQISSAYTGRFQFVLDSVCQRYHIKGVSAAVVRPGEGIWTGAYGESHAGVPITTDMVMPIGSNTKTFTSAIMLKMQENGQLNLDDTIGKWLQNIPNVSGHITIRQMLNHTSGLYSYTNAPGFFTALNADYKKVWQPEEMLQFIDVPDFAPGTSWNYSNTNYLLAGLIIKKILNEPFEVTVRRMISDPQGFTKTTVCPAETSKGTIPHGWTQMTATGPMEDMQVGYGYDNTAFLSMATSAGAIIATAEDVAKFWDALMNGRIINSTSLSEMKRVVNINAYNGYGLGIFKLRPVNTRIIYNHGGTCFGYLNENLMDTISGVSIAVLSNQDSIDNDMLMNYLVTALHKVNINMPPLAVADANKNADIKLYPNPASDVLQVNINNTAADTKLELFDMTGRKIMTNLLKEEHTNVPISGLANGLYIVRISNHDGMLTNQKIQVAR